MLLSSNIERPSAPRDPKSAPSGSETGSARPWTRNLIALAAAATAVVIASSVAVMLYLA
jgi:hypothetical protein